MMINNMSRKDWHDLVVPLVEALERIASAVEGVDARHSQSVLEVERIAVALEEMLALAPEPRVQAPNETTRALENRRGGTQP